MEYIRTKHSFFRVPEENDKIRIFCLPYAGGGASVFRKWSRELSSYIGVYPIQLPGRENRITEKPFTDMNKLVKAIFEEIKPYLDRPFIFFGHSIGAKISYELIKIIRDTLNLHPRHLIVSGSRAPHVPESNPIHNLQEDKFINELRRYSGMSEEVLQCKELMKIFMPFLRADFTLDETYVYSKDKTFNCPITAFCGSNDKEATKEEVKAWKDYTNGKFNIKTFDGGHFFIKTQENVLLDTISKIINNHLK